MCLILYQRLSGVWTLIAPVVHLMMAETCYKLHWPLAPVLRPWCFRISILQKRHILQRGQELVKGQLQSPNAKAGHLVVRYPQPPGTLFLPGNQEAKETHLGSHWHRDIWTPQVLQAAGLVGLGEDWVLNAESHRGWLGCDQLEVSFFSPLPGSCYLNHQCYKVKSVLMFGRHEHLKKDGTCS
jgi:hypothetical protein